MSFVARTPQGAVLIGSSGAELLTKTGSVTMKLTGARPSQPVAEQPLSSSSSYFTGKDASAWRTGVRHFGRVRSRDVYPGIDLVYYGAGGRLEYDLVVAPGASVKPIDLVFGGARRVRLDSNGDLLIDAAGTTIRQLQPRVYQVANGVEKLVDAKYKIAGRNRVRFELGEFDRSRELVIDPAIQYSTYIGGGGQDTATAIAVDPSGNAVIVGETTSLGIASGNVPQTSKAADQDVFVAKLSSTGSVQWLSYLGGSVAEAPAGLPQSAASATDTAFAVAVDDSGNAYVTGYTYSSDFPTRNPIQATYGGGGDGFVFKLSANGSQLMWSTFLGGSGFELPNGIALDRAGNVWVGGQTTSPNFPVRNGYQSGPAGGGGDAFLTRINAAGSSITYSTYMGGDGNELVGGIAVDANGKVYVTGSTTSTAFPIAAAYQNKRNGAEADAFVFCLDPEKNDLVFSTFLGGTSEDSGVKVAADGSGNAFVVGYTRSANFPVTRSARQGTYGGGASDMFVAKVGPSQLIYSTFIGGTGEDWAGDIVADAAGSVYVGGWTNSSNFPTQAPFQTTYAGGNVGNQRYDGTVLRLTPSGDALLFSSFLGGAGEDKVLGLALDRAGALYLTGITTSLNFPSATNTFSSLQAGLNDAFVVRLAPDTAINLLGANPSSVSLTARTSDTQVMGPAITLSGTVSPINFSASSSASWLKVAPVGGTTPATLTLTVDPSLLNPGANTAEIAVTSSTNTLRIPVTVNLTLAPSVTAIQPGNLVRGAGDTPIVVTGGGFASTSYVELNGTRYTTTFVDSRNLRVTVPAAVIASEGTLNVVVVNTDSRSNTFPLPVTASGAVFTAQGILHGATNTAGAVAPGEILILKGTGFGPATLMSASPVDGAFAKTFQNIRVLFDGDAAPILWATTGQIAVVAPYSISGRSSTQVVIETAGQKSVAVSVPVQQAVPGLFTTDNSGRGQVSALNPDGSYNSPTNPADRGAVVVLYGTGEGIVNQQFLDGLLVPADNPTRPVLPVTVLMGGIPADVRYAGGTPGQVSGLLQINVAIPPGVTPGAVPVTVFVGGFASPTSGVTLSVR